MNGNARPPDMRRCYSVITFPCSCHGLMSPDFRHWVFITSSVYEASPGRISDADAILSIYGVFYLFQKHFVTIKQNISYFCKLFMFLLFSELSSNSIYNGSRTIFPSICSQTHFICTKTNYEIEKFKRKT